MAKKDVMIQQLWIFVVLALLIGFVLGFIIGKAVTPGTTAATGEGFTLPTTPISITNIDSCQEITQSGQYKLTSNIDSSTADIACIKILASNVILDCQNNKIHVTNNKNGIDAYQVDSITIRNCKVDYSYNGIFFSNVDNSKVINSQLTNNANLGIYVSGENNAFENNIIKNNGEGGIYLGYYAAQGTTTLKNNVVCKNGVSSGGKDIYLYIGASVTGTGNTCLTYSSNYHDSDAKLQQGCKNKCLTATITPTS